MSWSLNKTVETPEELDGVMPDYVVTTEAAEQVGIAVAGAKAILSSGAVGTGKRFSVALSGHANAGHEPTPGWANDCITVSVTQLAATPA